MKRALLCLALCNWCLASDLPSVLQTTGHAVEEFWDQFSSINCTETVSQLKLGKDGKVLLRKESAFDYVALLRQVDRDLVIDESRSPLRSTQVKKGGPLLVTNGFSTLLFMFHPVLQNSFEYAAPVEEALQGRPVWRVGFRQAREGRSPSCLRVRGRDYPLAWAGTAWIERRSGAVVKISAALESGMEDVGLKALRATVDYAPVKFSRAPKEEWLPAVATVEAETAQQRWQNVHRFTNYKQFSVNSSTSTESPK